MNKLYSRIMWENFPSEKTALNERNLNKMDLAIDMLDDRVVQMDATKVNVEIANNLIKNWSIDDGTGIVTVEKLNGEKIIYDLNIEKIPVDFKLSDDGILTMTTDDGSKYTANIGAMIPVLTFNDSDTIAVSATGTGVNKTYSFSVKAGSVTEDKLQPNFLADVKTEAAKAQASQTSAAQSASAASSSATLAKSYTHGGTGARDGEDSDNAKYWAEQAKSASAVDIATTEKAGIVKPDGETITIDSDGTIHGQSKVDEMTGATADKDGTSGTVPAPLAGQQDLFLRADGTWAKVSGGSSIAPKDTIDPTISSGNAKATISWGDPGDVVLDGVVLSAWKGTKLVMKESGYPENENDGTLILDNTVRDAYKTSGYVVDGLTNGNTYYFALFPYSTDGVYNYSASNRLLGNPSLVKLDSCTNMQISAAMGSVTVTWDDPDATKTVGDNTATWAKTVLVYKQGSVAPNSPADGTIAVTETTRNQYASAGYEVTGLTDGEQYTFSLFAVSTDETPSDAVSATAKLWATLTVNTTEDTLFGKTVTATNEAKTVSGTFSGSGSATLQIPWIGLTTVTSTDGTDTADDTADVTAYMATYSTQITFIPDGETVTPIDDVSILLKCAGIKDKNYTTMEEVLADDEVMSDITMDENSMKYLARSTGFADDVCANETFMTYLGQSPYVDGTVLNSDLWKQKIKASQYWTLVYTTVYTIHAGASETITIDGVYGSFTTNSDGTVNHSLPLGELILTGSVSGQSFTRTVTKDITDVYVMPDGLVLYWYGVSLNETTSFHKVFDYFNTDNNTVMTNGSEVIGKSAIIDLTHYKTITGKCDDAANVEMAYMVICQENLIIDTDFILSHIGCDETHKISLDVSNISGVYRVIFGQGQFYKYQPDHIGGSLIENLNSFVTNYKWDKINRNTSVTHTELYLE